MNGRASKVNLYVKRALCQAAWVPQHTKDATGRAI